MKSSRTRLPRAAAALAVGLILCFILPCTAWAAEEGAKEPGWEGPLGVLLALILGLLACVGIGATALLLRIMLPGVAAAADASIQRLSTKRLLLVGIVPLVGAAFVAGGVKSTGSEALGGIFLLVVGLPIAIAILVGAMAALPRIGAGALRSGVEAAPLAQAAVGGLVLGLAMVSWALPPLGFAVSLLLAGWLLGTGLGTCIRRSAAAPPSEIPPGDAVESPVG